MRDRALRIDNRLLRCLDDAVGRLVGPAHYDRLLGFSGHGESSEERNKECSQCKAHVSGVWVRGCVEVRRWVTLLGLVRVEVPWRRGTRCVSGFQATNNQLAQPDTVNK